jgi:hypothetical protein
VRELRCSARRLGRRADHAVSVLRVAGDRREAALARPARSNLHAPVRRRGSARPGDRAGLARLARLLPRARARPRDHRGDARGLRAGLPLRGGRALRLPRGDRRGLPGDRDVHGEGREREHRHADAHGDAHRVAEPRRPARRLRDGRARHGVARPRERGARGRGALRPPADASLHPGLARRMDRGRAHRDARRLRRDRARRGAREDRAGPRSLHAGRLPPGPDPPDRARARDRLAAPRAGLGAGRAPRPEEAAGAHQRCTRSARKLSDSNITAICRGSLGAKTFGGAFPFA